MRILIAEDDNTSRKILKITLQKWGYDVLVARDGAEAAAYFRADNPPSLAILDWMMPNMDGIEVIREVRKRVSGKGAYIILLTAKTDVGSTVDGLNAGADDYLTKPFNRSELKARIQVGERVLGLQSQLAERIDQLETALSKVKTLSGLLPICAYCKKIRGDENYWQQVELYVADHSDAEFSHGICPGCYEKFIDSEISPS